MFNVIGNACFPMSSLIKQLPYQLCMHGAAWCCMVVLLPYVHTNFTEQNDNRHYHYFHLNVTYTVFKKNLKYLLTWSLCECKVAESHSSSVFLSASLYVFIPPLHLHRLPFLFLSQCF